MEQKVFLDYTQAELDRAYDQRFWAPNWSGVLQEFRRRSDEVRRELPCRLDVRYGPGANEKLDIFQARQAGAPIHVHLHGGAWRVLRKEDVSLLAPAITSAGVHYVAPDFSLLPDVRLPDMVAEVARAVVWVYENAGLFGGNRERIYLSGHSSGAHLCAVLLTLDWRKYRLPANVIKGALCVSGSYDLAPVLLSARGSYIELTTEEAYELSPVHHCTKIGCPVTIACAQGDTPEFVRQAKQFHQALRVAGRAPVWEQVEGCNHYEVIGRMEELALSRLHDGAT